MCPTSPNRLYLLAAKAAGLRKTAVGATRLCAVFLRHIFAAAETLRVSLSQPQKRQIQPERYVQLGTKIATVYKKTYVCVDILNT
jgi:hypothetical protein